MVARAAPRCGRRRLGSTREGRLLPGRAAGPSPSSHPDLRSPSPFHSSRIAPMKYRMLGRTGLFVSEICLGTMTFGGRGFWQAIGQLGQEEATALVRVAIE